MAERVTRGAAPVLLALLVLAASAPAQGKPTRQELGGVVIETSSPWPADVLPGWMPLDVRLQNGNPDPTRVDLRLFQGWASQSQSASVQELAAGESRTLHFSVPVRIGFDADFSLIAVVDQDESKSWSVYSDEGKPNRYKTYTLVSAATASDPGSVIADDTRVLHSELPRDWRAYTSLNLLVLDVRDGLPDAEVVSAILDWVAAGGVLQVLGDPRGLDLPLEERFRRGIPDAPEAPVAPEPPGDGDPSESGGDDADQALDAVSDPHWFRDDDGVRSYRVGFGWLQLTSEFSPFAAPNWGDKKPDLASPPYIDHAPGPMPLALGKIPTIIPGLGTLPVNQLVALLVLVFLVMGPIQFSWLKRRRAPPARMLLLTPLLGFGFAALVLGMGLFMQGIDVRESVTSITWLDQGRHHAASLAKRTVFSGSAFGALLHYGPEAAVLPLAAEQGSTASYVCDLDRGALYGDFLPVRAPSDELLVRSARARQRLSVEREDGTLAVVNGLESDLLELVVRDFDGSYHELALAELAAGERALLMPIDAPAGELLFAPPDYAEPLSGRPTLFDATGPDPGRPRLGHLPRTLPPGCYAALLDRSPFLDDGGVPREVTARRHLLVGSLEPGR